MWESDVGYSFRKSPVAVGAAVVAFVCVFCAVFAGWVAPHNPFDLATLDLGDARLPPAWTAEGSRKFLLGTDDQGRDILSALMYGARISLAVGFASVALSAGIGVALGLLAGFTGGWVDAALMRLSDVMLSFPAILVALLIAGVGRALFPHAPDSLALGVLILSITLTGWVQYARTVRAYCTQPVSEMATINTPKASDAGALGNIAWPTPSIKSATRMLGKDSVASVMMAAAIWMVASTNTGPITLGSTWRRMMRSGATPITRAACTYSLLRSTIVEPRTVRAY